MRFCIARSKISGTSINKVRYSSWCVKDGCSPIFANPYKTRRKCVHFENHAITIESLLKDTLKLLTAWYHNFADLTFTWIEDCQAAFDRLKTALTQPLVHDYYTQIIVNYRVFILTTYTSGPVIGYILGQVASTGNAKLIVRGGCSLINMNANTSCPRKRV